MLSKKRGKLFGSLCRVNRWRNLAFEALKDTKFLLPHSEIIERSEVKGSTASSLEACNTCWEGLELKLVE